MEISAGNVTLFFVDVSPAILLVCRKKTRGVVETVKTVYCVSECTIQVLISYLLSFTGTAETFVAVWDILL